MIKIISDSACDLKKAYTEQNNIGIVPFNIIINEDTSLKDKIEIQSEELLEMMKNDSQFFAKTSQPSPDDYKIEFEKAAKQGSDIICFTITSELSGSYQSAEIAKRIIQEQYDVDIRIVDSLSASLGQGILIKKAVEMVGQNKSLDEIEDYVNKIKLTGKIFLLVDTLKYLEKGGRISKSKRLIGNALSLKPILKLENGKLDIVDKVIGKKRAIKHLLKLIKSEKNNASKGNELFVVHADSKQEASEIYDELKTENNLPFDIELISPVLVCHSGNGSIAVGIVNTEV
ncbi:DegV family EDD domain-containing protein [Finegoldia sp. BIOML-A3]|uniref:DegV family protein n=1 Tax=unclassified Finegoldia TaxID=2619637 RepID=UPI0012B119AA|nr:MULTISPECIES: DegV family protein [unclassified Finegoldia]MSA98578.1 DegV family EDD domain-containing protein [Finegoldia sp. BIOML-A3]MSB92580.1 DegV family EDD domain-containing protein [Finegoldia sp. BIOML-A4]